MSVRRYHASLFAGTLVLATLSLLAHEAHAQQITLSSTRSLNFGRFVAGTGGTIVISPAGVRSRTGGVVLLNSPTVGQAMFNVGKSSNGGNNKAVIISLPANGSTRLSSGANSMAVNAYTNSPSALVSVPNGGTSLAVGATLVVAPNQPPGNYTGTFPLTVNFQ
ncbi:DUF4402 domain-containing protein [Massilia consociata]|uniref:DUF4402 domain-containing protein n=1 Tax=Massilia consociata TaxID=760117 RepID=A0ABV6FN33_9BURK